MLSRALLAVVLALAVATPAFADDEFREEQWALDLIRAEEAWPSSTGVGAVVAVIDTGVQADHPDLGGRLLPGADWVGGAFEEADGGGEGPEDEDPDDGNGHGTHVTGIVVANRDNDEGIAGVAPGARVLPLRVLDDGGSGFTTDTIRAINYAIAQKVHVINLSLGDFLPLQSTLFNDADYQDALQRAVDAGIVVVIAAGNNSFPRCENPEVDEMLCVGAVDRTPTRAGYSSFGGGVDLMAPGGSGVGGSSEDVLSTYIDSSYESISGTSQAAPHVAGVAALLVSLGLRGNAAADRIVETAADSCVELMGECGAGVVDAAAAVEGLAPPSGGTGGPGAAEGSFTTKRRVKRRAVRRRGFRVKCEAARPGECKVVVRRRGKRVARGRGDVPAEISTRVTAELNRRGRRATKRMGKRLRVKVWVTLPGEAPRARRVKIRR